MVCTRGSQPVVRVPLVVREQSVGGTQKPILQFLLSTFDQESWFGGTQVDKNTIGYFMPL